MFLIHCPHCGESRAEEEFHAVGPAHLMRPADPAACSDPEWGDYLYFRDNPRGPHRELWVHASGCRKHFNLARDTLTYEILASYPVGGSFEAAVAVASAGVSEEASAEGSVGAPGASR